ncbi:MAG: UvrD-helicase domain-containing protein [Gaiellaceae bacterium]
MRAPSQQQVAAIEEPGIVFVSAGAGTGKTTVLVERFVKAVCERGLAIDNVLVITYTERAAGELRSRIRERLVELERHDLARALDGAWISTIHGFCHRLLRAHPFEAGLDPRFRVLDENQASVLRSEAFAEALASYIDGSDAERVRLLATYGGDGLRGMLTSVYDRLRSAGRALALPGEPSSSLGDRLAELKEVAELTLSVTETGLEGRAQVEDALELVDPAPPAERLLDLSEFRVGGAERERFASFGEALAAVEQAALDEIATRDRALLEGLLGVFDEAYSEAKARESALDFEDLQLRARSLLELNEKVREDARWRFRSILVDEFQDTNRLQCELVDLVAGEEVFFVGDEFQSIYRFRHADVEVFRERRAASAGVLPLTENYRSRPEVLSVVNHLFGAEFGTDYEPLVAAGRFADPLFGPAVELLVTDKSTYREGEVHWRVAEARHVARRVRELVDAGEAAAGDIVLLFAAGTDAERYEEALRREGLPTYRAAGRGYFGQQQVADLTMYLRLILNRYDDEALVSVLASPFVGVSNDALYLLRRSAGRRPLFSGMERELPAELGPRDRRLFEAFRQRYDRLVRLSATAGLERLCERIISEHDYDLAVLALWDGRRRYANLRKLGRLARSYEDLRGPDIEGFLRFLADQEAAGAKESEAVAEEEGGDAVRLLTIHSAKGLEFKVVVVADAGRNPEHAARDEILCLPDGRVGFKIVDPSTGKRHAASGFEELREAERAADEAESRRLYYVAMTRAIDRLIVSGAVDPTSTRDAKAPIRWILDRLEADLDADDQVELEREGARVLMRVDRRGEAVLPGPQEPTLAQLELFATEEAAAARVAPKLPALVPVPEPPPFRIRRLSYSALALFGRCSYRFYAERIAGLRSADDAGGIPGGEGLAATEIGDAVHVLLEHGVSAEESGERVLARYPGATADDLERIGTLVQAWHDSPLAHELAASQGVHPELPFAFEHDGVLLHGRFDVFRLTDARALVVDYKTNRLEGLTPEEALEDDYSLQRLVYALAAFRAGADEVEVAYVFLEQPENVVTRTFARSEVPELEAELSAAIAAIQNGEFRPTPSEFACAGCPALDVVCAGPRLPGTAPVAVSTLTP